MYIVSTGNYLPGEKITNSDLANIFGDHIHTVGEHFGVFSRHFCINYKNGNHESNEFNSDFCVNAILKACEKNKKFDLNETDLIITTSCTPDYTVPTLPTIIQEKLKIKKCLAIDLRAGCSGTIQALLIAKQMINSGVVKKAIITGSECCSPNYYKHLLNNKNNVTVKDIMNILMFGDGAGALLIDSIAYGNNSLEVKDIDSGSELAHLNSGFIVTEGGTKESFLENPNVTISDLFKHNPKLIQKNLPKVIDLTRKKIINKGFELKDFKYVIGPQANQNLIDSMNKALNKHNTDYFYLGDKIGNIGGGSLILALDELLKNNSNSSEDKILLMAMESPKWMYGYSVLEKV